MSARNMIAAYEERGRESERQREREKERKREREGERERERERERALNIIYIKNVYIDICIDSE